MFLVTNLEEKEMKVRKSLLSGLLAAVLIIGSGGMKADAADIKVDQQIPAEEVDSVYNQQIDSNLLPGWPAGPNIYSESGIVMDIDSGAILYAKKINDQHYPASITKVLTALVALENSQMTDKVPFTQECIDFLEYGDAHIGMKVGEEISMEDALYGMLLASANEVSYAIGNSIEGGYDTFINKMNEKVMQLGGTNSHFVNTNGLHNDEHYTTAHDMALIGSAAFQYDEFKKITGTRQYTVEPTAITSEPRTFQQNHKMLFQGNRNYYEYCVGGKTGYTDQALTTLVTFAQKDDKNLVAVTLRVHGGGQNSYVDTRAMLDYAFANFSKVPITKEQITDENVKSVEDGAYVMLPSTVTQDKLDVVLQKPTEVGDKQGTLVYSYNGQEVGKVPVTITDKCYNKIHGIEEKKEKKADKKVEEKEKKKDKGIPFVWKVVLVIVGIVVVLGLLFIWLLLYRRKKIRERRRKAKMRRQRQQRQQRPRE